MQTLFERNPDVSVIIPVYNLERFLGPMLQSLADQDRGDYIFQIIFVLNNCTDNSEQVIRDSELDCTIINCETQGCGPARNAGLDIATGTYIWFMDGDDWLTEPDAIKAALDMAISQELDVLRIPFDSDNYLWDYFSMVWQYLIRREFIGELRFPNYQPAEDDAFMATILERVGLDRTRHLKLPYINRGLYYYNYMREGSNMFRVFRGEII